MGAGRAAGSRSGAPRLCTKAAWALIHDADGLPDDRYARTAQFLGLAAVRTALALSAKVR